MIDTYIIDQDDNEFDMQMHCICLLCDGYIIEEIADITDLEIEKVEFYIYNR